MRRKREVATIKKREEFFDIRKEKRGSTKVIFWWREHIHRPAIYRGVQGKFTSWRREPPAD